MKFYATLILLGLAAACGVHGQDTIPTNNIQRKAQVERVLHQDPFDIVFLIDESGSMDPELDYFKNNVDTIFEVLNNIAPGSRAGLVGFGSGGAGGHPRDAHVHTVLTDNLNDFQRAADDLTTQGPNEAACACLVDVVKNLNMGFRKKRDFGVVLISDEESNHDGDVTQQMAIDALMNTDANDAEAKGVFVGILPTGPVTTSFEPFKVATDGEIYSLTDFENNPEDILTEAISYISHAVDKVNIVLSPQRTAVDEGTPVEMTAYVTEAAAGGGLSGISNELVTFHTVCGVDADDTTTRTTNANGEASVSVNADNEGRKLLQACFEHYDVTKCSNIVMVSWRPKVAKANPIPPTARCKSVTVAADDGDCQACVSAELFNDGSTDPEDDAANLDLDFSVEPSCPYELGITPVVLTVTDSDGESATCETSIEVTGTGAPTINCNAPEFSAPLLEETTYTATATAGDCAGPLTLEITWDDCYRVANGYFKYKANTNVISRNGPSITIGANTIRGDNIEWLVEATDGTTVWEKNCKMIIVPDPRQYTGNLRRRRETAMLL